MAALGAQSIASSYEQLLHVDADGGGNSTTHVSVKDGDNGTTFGFTIASDALMMSSTNRLEFGDTGTYIHQSADGVLDLVSDTEIEINATTIDINGAVAMDGAITGGTNITISGELDAATLDISGNADIDGTTNLDAVDIDGNVQLDGTFTVGTDGSGQDVILYSGTAGDNFTWDSSEEKLTITGTNGQTALDVADGNVSITDDLAVDGTSNLDNTDIDGTLAVDGATISLDATTSFNIDNSNTSNGITIGTATSAVPISIGHTTSVVTINDEVDITGTVDINDATDASSSTTGALKVDGGVGVAKKLYVGTDLDVDGTANLDAVDIDGAVQIDNTITVGADDQGYDIIFYGDTASSNMTWDTSADDLILNDARILVDQDDDSQAIRIDSEAASYNALYITAKYGLNITQDISGGRAATFSRDIAEAGSNPLLSLTDDNANNTQDTLFVQQDGAGKAVNIDQNGNNTAIYIDSDSTSESVFRIDSPLATTGNVLQINDADALTTGGLLYISSNSDSGGSRILCRIINDHVSADTTTILNLYQDGNEQCLDIDAFEANYTSNLVVLNAVGRSSNSGFKFLQTYTDGDDDTQHILYGDGTSAADGTWGSSGADYAEYFESKDGNSIAVGTTVKLDGDKIVSCGEGDTPIGVIRPYGTSVSVGNMAWNKWQGKYLVDDYNSPIMEEYSVTVWIDGIKDGKNNDIQYHTDKIPSDVTVPDDATVTSEEKDGSKLMRKKLNPDYDESQSYTPREDRDEWHIVGLLGQIPVTKGQPTGSWIKMKDVSDSVEMYFVK